MRLIVWKPRLPFRPYACVPRFCGLGQRPNGTYQVIVASATCTGAMTWNCYDAFMIEINEIKPTHTGKGV